MEVERKGGCWPSSSLRTKARMLALSKPSTEMSRRVNINPRRASMATTGESEGRDCSEVAKCFAIGNWQYAEYLADQFINSSTGSEGVNQYIRFATKKRNSDT